MDQQPLEPSHPVRQLSSSLGEYRAWRIRVVQVLTDLDLSMQEHGLRLARLERRLSLIVAGSALLGHVLWLVVQWLAQG